MSDQKPIHYAELNKVYRAIDSFNLRFDTPFFSQIQGIGNLYSYRKRYHIRTIPTKEKLDERFQLLVTEAMQSIKDRQKCMNELYDIMIRNNLPYRHLFTELEGVDEKKLDAVNVGSIKDTRKTLHTISQDSQNVHDSYINKTIKRVARRIVRDYKVYDDELSLVLNNLISEMIQVYPKVNDYVDEITSYTTDFDMGITLSTLLCSLWKCIRTHEHAKELKQRLYEELKSCAVVCSSGKLCRLVNVLQGFDDRYIVGGDEHAMIQFYIFAHLNKEFKKCEDEEILDGLTTKAQKTLDFIEDIVSDKLEEWKKNLDTTEDVIRLIVNKYLG